MTCDLASLRFDGAGFNAETQRRRDAERIWAGDGSLPGFHRGVGEGQIGDFLTDEPWIAEPLLSPRGQ